MNKLTFDEFVKLVDAIPQPDASVGIFRIKVNNANRHYTFTGLKVTASNNDALFGFSLRHYGGKGQLKQKYATSKFYDKDYEDVQIAIWRGEFRYAYKVDNYNEIGVVTQYFTLQINW